ncbi:MAG: transglycosylase domain-containing protein [Deltaproteobacteria bacterium]|nr:transglycosylase domain-containing protein [Deltaproteobacteria bacterium]MBW2210885.1 transglycosylase domain-containing protein [Deltaproteobacteria bacterium]MBW2550557.1 transglycosylase domain-containing protein [Deltaproteobacteria bacterium]MBW2627509.1 transglycosylase domain-containing protein [Deltaproteobacteria bacterium]MBW2685044.1 transglycosylase domain-containing protein [Deltaproteobacteria bacterium]
MLRFLSERRAWVVAAFVALALVIGLWIWGAPRATARAATLIGDRLGVDARIEEAHLSLGGVELDGVEMRGRHGGFVVRIDHVDARMSLIGAVFRGSRSVRNVSARGVDVTVDLADEGFDDSIAELRGRVAGSMSAPGATVTGTKGRGRTYAVDDLTVRVVDADGPLISLTGASLHKEGDELRGGVGETLLGERSDDHAAVGPSKIALRRTHGTWRLQDLEIASASVRSLRNGDAEGRALTSRIRDAMTSLRAPDTDTGADTGIGTDAAPDPVLFNRLTPDARIVVSGVQIESRTSGGHVERIRDFEWDLRGGGNGWYQVTVGGKTSNKGTLKVDLSVMPAEARAEGSIRLRRISLALIAPFAPEIPLYNAELGTVSAELELAVSSSDQVSIGGSLRLRELALASERIAPKPVENINIDVAGRGIWHPVDRLLQIESGRVRMGKTQVLIEGELERTTEHYRVDLTAKLPPTACNDVVRAIPQDVLGSLARFDWSGNWSALAQISLDSRELEATVLSIRVRNLCQFEETPKWVRVERFQEPFLHRAIEPDETVFEMRTGPGTAYWVALGDISPFMPPAVISHEDGAFYEHGGFAPWAIRDALVRNLQEGHYVVGASTISMQLAKNLYLQREKTIARKVQEVILTWWLENALNKDEIIELYLNVIEYGPSVYGLRHASTYYFGREPVELSPAESAFLACMLPSPKRYHVSYQRGALTRSMKNRMRRLLEHMAKRERIGPEALSYGLAELDDFRFRRDGDPWPEPRVLPPLGAPEIPDPEALDPFEAPFVAP